MDNEECTLLRRLGNHLVFFPSLVHKKPKKESSRNILGVRILAGMNARGLGILLSGPYLCA
jgi:hypothetical protein